MVHQHKGDVHGQARSEQETVHAVHAEVNWVCRNGTLHAGAPCTIHCVPYCLSCLPLAYIVGTGCLHNNIHFPYSKHSTPSPSMYHTMQKVPTAKWSHCVPCLCNFNCSSDCVHTKL